MNNEDSNMAANAVCFAAEQCKETIQQAAYEYVRPCVVFRPTLSRDGNKWCALFGADLMSGVAGFGDSPSAAMYAFDKAWSEKLI